MIARLLYFQHVCDGFDTRITLDIGKNGPRLNNDMSNSLCSVTMLKFCQVVALFTELITEHTRSSRT